MTAKNFRINFAIKSNIKGRACYDPSTRTIYFADIYAITEGNIAEELFHAYQDSFYPHGISRYTTVGKANIEFEAKIYTDVAKTGCCSFFGPIDEYALPQQELTEYLDKFYKYLELLKVYEYKGISPFTPYTYRDWLTIFLRYNKGYSSTQCSPDFSDTNALNHLLKSY